MLWPALQGIWTVMCTAWHVGSSTDKPGDLRALLMQLWPQRYVCAGPLPLLHGRLAAPHTFCHLTQTCGACKWQMLHSTGPRGHKWPFGLSFFQSQRIICLTMATNATRGTPMEPWVAAACLLRSHLPRMNRVYVYVRGVEWVNVCARALACERPCMWTCPGRCLTNSP